MKLSSTDSNLIVGHILSERIRRVSYLWQGTFGNLGMYTAGIPIGLLVDSRGPRPGALLGAVLLGVGYFSLYRGMHPHLAHGSGF